MRPLSRFESCALVAVSFAAGLMLALAVILLGGWRVVQVAGFAALVCLPFAIWRGWFAGRDRGGDAG